MSSTTSLKDQYNLTIKKEMKLELATLSISPVILLVILNFITPLTHLKANHLELILHLSGIVYFITGMGWVSALIESRCHRKEYNQPMTKFLEVILQEGEYNFKNNILSIKYNNALIKMNKIENTYSFSIDNIELWPSLTSKQSSILKKVEKSYNQKPKKMDVNIKARMILNKEEKSIE